MRLPFLLPFLALALGQTLYLPLDDRPPNLAPCAWGVLCLPREAYRGPEGADLGELRTWLLATPGERLVASLDVLAYGGFSKAATSPSPRRTPWRGWPPCFPGGSAMGGRCTSLGSSPAGTPPGGSGT